MPHQNKKSRKRILPIYILGIMHLFIGLNATISGLLLMLKPDGSWIGLKLDWLYGSPFNDYFIPGLLLFFFLGMLSLITLYGLFQHPSKWIATKIYPIAHWGWFASLAEGIIILIWIASQIILTHYFWLQPAVLLVGLFIIILTLNKSTVNFYAINRFKQ